MEKIDIPNKMYFVPKKIKIRFPSEKIAENSISVPHSLDSLNLPIKNGLQDTNLGPQASEPLCTNCGSSYFSCPGHFGSIDLHTMIFNPILFQNLFVIYSSSCDGCFIFKLSELDREQTNSLFEEGLFSILKGTAKEKCPSCNIRNAVKKKDLNIIVNGEYILPSIVFDYIYALALKEKDIFERLNIDYRAFFLHRIFVLPNRFRPLNVLGDQIFESSHNIHLAKIIKINNQLKGAIEHVISKKDIEKQEFEKKNVKDKQKKKSRSNRPPVSNSNELHTLAKESENTEKKILKNSANTFFEKQKNLLSIDNGVNSEIDKDLNDLLKDCSNEFIIKNIVSNLQTTISHYFDNSDYPAKIKPQGVKQILEKKEGIFRQYMMGKRVNYTARTVISPDPYIATDEIGIPIDIARQLTFPERITPFNRYRLEQCVINGPKYPGAEFIVERGAKKLLKFVRNRKVVARTLLKNNAIVYRHMLPQDFVLVNRQPTLHKPSLMSHRVRILNDKTIRLHYVNCGSYNADFDGDEMNIHLCQNYKAMAEHSLSATHENFVLNGKPLRGLVQDYIVAIFQITLKNSFFTSEETFNLLLASQRTNFKMCKPAITRPCKRYSGKQIVQMLISSYTIVNYKKKNKIPPLYWCISNIDESNFSKDESIVNIQSGIFIHGVLDKSQIGPTTDSLIHYIGRIINYEIANDLLTAMCRMISQYLIGWGVSLGIRDLILTNEADRLRAKILRDGIKEGDSLTYKTLGISNINLEINEKALVRDINLSHAEIINLNNTIKKKMHETTSAISDLLIRNVKVPFPQNNMARIILSGAKGSIVNFSQISGLLGQQSLEGGRVPLMKNGRPLAFFHDIGVLSNGFITNRFVTGLTPASFFFHCQGGREGLIDTAVKTSRAGYLQRCLVTILENIIVHYDGSVRDENVIQYVYGDDGLNPSYISDSSKYRKIIHPGESVGVLAAQAIGEPSTQMTLNTFHLAGCATNVTLGMPRLKEILMIGGHSPTSLRASLNADIVQNLQIKKKVDKILRSLIQLPLSKTLFYHRVVQSEKTEIIFVFNRDISENTKTDFKRTFFKEINKSTQQKDLIIEAQVIEYKETDDEIEKSKKENDEISSDNSIINEEENGSQNALDNINTENISSNKITYFEKLEDLKDDIKSTKKPIINSIHEKIYSKKELQNQINENDFDKANVIKINMNTNVSIDYVIEKMLDRFFIIKSGIESVDFDQEKVIFGGMDYVSIFEPILPASIIPISVQTENASLSDFINVYTTYSTDIESTLQVLGVEAARFSIVQEIRTVFSAYGIDIDIRHLMLIADKMTFNGVYSAFNRHKMSGSILSKMSFESSYSFLRKSYLFRQEDDLEEPSSRIVLGLPVKNGTGSFDILDADTMNIL